MPVTQGAGTPQLWLPPLRLPGWLTPVLPPASFSFGYRDMDRRLPEREVRTTESVGTPHFSFQHPQTQPGGQKEEEGGLPLEVRLCLVCRDEKVPMTAPMAAKT